MTNKCECCGQSIPWPAIVLQELTWDEVCDLKLLLSELADQTEHQHRFFRGDTGGTFSLWFKDVNPHDLMKLSKVLLRALGMDSWIEFLRGEK